MNSILYFGSDTVKFLRGSAGKKPGDDPGRRHRPTGRGGSSSTGVITDERRLCEALNGLQPG